MFPDLQHCGSKSLEYYWYGSTRQGIMMLQHHLTVVCSVVLPFSVKNLAVCATHVQGVMASARARLQRFL